MYFKWLRKNRNKKKIMDSAFIFICNEICVWRESSSDCWSNARSPRVTFFPIKQIFRVRQFTIYIQQTYTLEKKIRNFIVTT